MALVKLKSPISKKLFVKEKILLQIVMGLTLSISQRLFIYIASVIAHYEETI